MSCLMIGNIPVAKQKQWKEMIPKVIIVSTNQTSMSPKVSTRSARFLKSTPTRSACFLKSAWDQDCAQILPYIPARKINISSRLQSQVQLYLLIAASFWLLHPSHFSLLLSNVWRERWWCTGMNRGRSKSSFSINHVKSINFILSVRQLLGSNGLVNKENSSSRIHPHLNEASNKGRCLSGNQWSLILMKDYSAGIPSFVGGKQHCTQNSYWSYMVITKGLSNVVLKGSAQSNFFIYLMLQWNVSLSSQAAS